MDRIREILSNSGDYLILLLVVILILILGFFMRTIIMDDAYISLRYADNLLSGNGLVFNIGDKVEGITNIGWTFFLVLFLPLLGSLLTIKIIGLILIFVTIYFQFRISLLLNNEKQLIVPALIILMTASQLEFILFSIAGMETALLSCLLSIMIWMVLKKKSIFLIAGFGSYLFLVHPEAILVYPLARLIQIAGNKFWNRIVKADYFYLFLVILFSLARYFYFNSLVPNTFQAKESSCKTILLNLFNAGTGNNSNIPILFTSPFTLIIMIFGIVSIVRISKQAAAFLGASLLVGYSFSLYAPVDWTGLARYFAPYLPLAILILWQGIAFFIDFLSQSFSWIMKFKGVLILMLSLALILPSISRTAFYLRPINLERYPGFVLASRNLVKPAKWINKNTPPDSIIACRRIGALGFFSKRYIFDYLFGLTDRTIARANGSTPALIKDPIIGKIWRQKSPHYYLEDRNRVELLLNLTGENEFSFHIQGIEYKLIKSFIIGKQSDGNNVEWWLCKRIIDNSDS